MRAYNWKFVKNECVCICGRVRFSLTRILVSTTKAVYKVQHHKGVGTKWVSYLHVLLIYSNQIQPIRQMYVQENKLCYLRSVVIDQPDIDGQNKCRKCHESELTIESDWNARNRHLYDTISARTSQKTKTSTTHPFRIVGVFIIIIEREKSIK